MFRFDNGVGETEKVDPASHTELSDVLSLAKTIKEATDRFNDILTSPVGLSGMTSEPQLASRPPVLVLSSTGPSVESRGNLLGVFEYLQQYNNSPAYRQRHSVAGTQPHHLYRDDEGNWAVGWKLGGSSPDLLNRSSTASVPPDMWLYRFNGSWFSDPEITVTTSHPSVCGVITISLHGAAATAQPETGGEYRATGDWSAGRPVFSNGLTYLCVEPGGTKWCVSYSHYIDNKQ